MKINITKTKDKITVKTEDGEFSFIPIVNNDDLKLSNSKELSIEKLIENIALNIKQNPMLILNIEN